MEKLKFYDENGKEVEFFVDAKFTLDDTDYVALYKDDEEPEIYILKIEIDETGEEYLAGIDDKELQEAINAYEELISDSDRWLEWTVELIK